MADFGIKKPQIIDRFGRGADGRPARARRTVLRYGNRRGQSIDAIRLRLIEPLQELPRMKRESLDVSPLTLGIKRVERETRLAAATHAANHDEPVLRNIDIDVFEVVHGDAAQLD